MPRSPRVTAGGSVRPIVLLSGPIGAGKTTVARELVAISPGPLAWIEGDVFWTFVAKPAAAPRIEQWKTIMRAMIRAASAFARDGCETIVDFSMPPWFVEAARARIEDTPIDYVVLLPTEAVCAARAAARTAGPIADYAPYRDLHASFEGLDDHTITGDALDPVALAVQIRAGLDAERFRVRKRR